MSSASVGREFVERFVTERLPLNLLKPLADLGRWLGAVSAQAVVVGSRY